MKIQTKQYDREQSELSPVLAPLPPSQTSLSASRNPSADVFHLWHGKDALVPSFSNKSLPVPILNDAERRRSIAREISNVDIDVRHMSAREMANLSTEFYMQGLISWEEYDALAFQSELHPDYNKTVGALLEKQAEPDAPRDFVREWEKRLAFVRRYNRNDVNSIQTAAQITKLLRQLAGVLAYE